MKIKKLMITIIMMIAVIAVNIPYVSALGCTLDLKPEKTNYAEGQIVNIEVVLSGIDSTEGIYGIEGELSYATDVFEPIISEGTTVVTGRNSSEMKGLNGWDSLSYASSTQRITSYTANPTKSDKAIIKISLKVKQGAKLGNTVVMLRNVKISDKNSSIDTNATARVNITTIDQVDQPSVIPATSTPNPIPSATKTPSPSPTAISTVKPTVTPTPVQAGDLPQTGIQDYAMPVLLGSLIISLIAYIAYRRYKDI